MLNWRQCASLLPFFAQILFSFRVSLKVGSLACDVHPPPLHLLSVPIFLLNRDTVEEATGLPPFEKVPVKSSVSEIVA